MMSNKYIGTMGRSIAVAMLVAGMTIAARGQQQMRLTLDDAIQLSIANSGKLKISQAKADEAAAALHEAKDHRLPDVKMSGSYLRVNNPNVDLKIKTSSSSSSSGGNASGEQSGGTSSLKVNQVAYGLVNASLPLFSGMRIQHGIESARYLEQAAKLDADRDKEEVVQLTIAAYCNYYKAIRNVDLVKESLAKDEQRVKDFTNLEKNGLLARNDLLKVQLQSSNTELALLEAENNKAIANTNMNLLLGLPEQTQLVLDSNGIADLPAAGTLTQWEETALSHRKDRDALTARVNASDAAVKAAKGEYYPSVALAGGYIAATIPNVLTVTNALNGGLGLQYNLGALWKTGAKVDAAKARKVQMQAMQSILADQVRTDINTAYHNYVLALRKTDVYAKAVEQAAEHYRITKNKYDNSLVTTTDLLDADVALLQSKLHHAFSKTDAFVAYKKLQETAGVINVVVK